MPLSRAFQLNERYNRLEKPFPQIRPATSTAASVQARLGGFD